MYLIEAKTGKKLQAEISLVKPEEYKVITKRDFFFDWKLEKDFEVYKVSLQSNSIILGLVSIERIPEEFRFHIRLLSVSSSNKGKNKQYERIVGNLLTYVSKLAVKEFAELACVSLKPKEAIAQHYIDTYGMNITGATLSLELTEILNLIEKYDHETSE